MYVFSKRSQLCSVYHSVFLGRSASSHCFARCMSLAETERLTYCACIEQLACSPVREARDACWLYVALMHVHAGNAGFE
ncbi:hypothetical protein RRG08_048601 [Elysia crispata]|uniref:Uncharacterized protein n=1 Tax=Elysia crispata TaxID=231223 RepID=A0AAE1ACM9_9GAST|nr:hypothetical protein RRG08_048601 [Elysia crispata]